MVLRHFKNEIYIGHHHLVESASLSFPCRPLLRQHAAESAPFGGRRRGDLRCHLLLSMVPVLLPSTHPQLSTQDVSSQPPSQV
jgi:hypothetical protein